MKKNLKHKLLTIVVLIALGNVFGQNSKNKIFFLNDYYSAFAYSAKYQNDMDNYYKEEVQTAIFNHYFLKSEYSDIVNDFLSSPIQNTTELKKAIERINANKKRIESKITSALEKSHNYIKNDSLTIYILPANQTTKQLCRV